MNVSLKVLSTFLIVGVVLNFTTPTTNSYNYFSTSESSEKSHSSSSGSILDYSLSSISQIRRNVETNLYFDFLKNIKSEKNTFLSTGDLKAFLQLMSKKESLRAKPSEAAIDPCPDIDFIDLRGVAGYPQIDDLTSCGSSDTLSMIIFTGDPGTINGFEFEIDLPDGIEYAGWEYAQLGNTLISNIDPKVSRPVFLVNGITGDSLVIVNIGLRSTCDVDISESLFFDYNFEYTFIDTSGAVQNCEGSFRPELEFNSAVHIPVLNVLTPPDPEEVTITTVGGSFCQMIQISQDGLNTYLDSFSFEILGLELYTDINLDSISINNIKVPAGDIQYDAGTQTTTVLANGTYFPANLLNNPADNRMNTDEITDIEVCYSLNNCPSITDLPFSYSAKFGCDDEICDQSSLTTFLRIRPTGSLQPIATASLNAAGIEICGTPGAVSLTVTNPNSATEQNIYSDLKIGFQTCPKPNLEVTGVTVGGVSIPAGFYSWVGDDINIDLSANVDPTLGLIDYDTDGFYDDLPGGSTLTAEVLIEVVCGLAGDDCASIDCEDVQFYVEGKTNCGNTFKYFPVPDAFDLVYGATSVSNPTEAEFGTTGVSGYDLGTYSNDGAPIAGTNSSSVEVEYCYTFEKLNIDDCPGTATNYLQVTFAGDPHFAQDIEFVADSDSLSTDGGVTYSAVGSTTLTKPDLNTAVLTVNGGSNNANVCYKYAITMDSCICAPVGYFTGNQQVIASCSTCSGGCEFLKACRTTTFRADPNCTPCDCIVQNRHVRSERSNLGYTDKTMTTKHTRASLIAAGGAADLTRFLPGDTLVYEDYFVIKDTVALQDINSWRFTWSMRDNASTTWENINKLDLLMDAHNSALNEFKFSKEGVGNRLDIDLSALSGCLTDNITIYGGVWAFNTTPWGDAIDNVPSQNSSVDYADNNQLRFYLWNYKKVEDCGGTNAHFTGGNCVDDVISAFSIAVGDTLHFKWTIPLIKNPHRAAKEILGIAPTAINIGRIFPTMSIYKHDTIAGDAAYCSTYMGAACRAFSPIYFDDAGEIDAVTRMDLDNCGGTVVHEFTVKNFPGPVGDPWFTKEYRPFMTIKDVDAMVRSPLAYCGNGNVENVGINYDVTVDSTVNMFCVPVVGFDENLCAVDSGQLVGKVIFDLEAQGVPPLGIGMGNCDTIRLSYDLCMVCPEDITDISEYDLVYDWSYVNTPEKKDSRDNVQYRCYTVATHFQHTVCDELGLAHNVYYWEELEFDTLMNKKDRLSEVFLLTDNRNSQDPVTIENLGANLLASDSPGVSEEIQLVKICNPDIDDTATGVGASVTIPSSIRLENVYADAAGTTILTTTLNSDDGTHKIYSVTLPFDTYTPGQCDSIYVGTTLLYCPDPSEALPKVCVGAFSGCAPEAVKTALGASGICGGSAVCYAYISGEVALQTEWFDMPIAPSLCDTLFYHVRIKNVKELVLLNLVPMFDLPTGFSVIPGSWDVSYPGGEVAPLNWIPIGTDPDVISGNTYSYSDDALWSSKINMDGLQGVSAANTSLDSNKVAFRFKAYADCDNFLSGDKLITEVTAVDPCSDQAITSGIVESPGVIISGGEPINFAQLLLISDPEVVNCEGTVNTFGITALNTGTKSTSDSVLVCITFPEDLDYQTGTLFFTAPSGFTPNAITETVVGIETEVCFNAPQLTAYGTFSINFDAAQDLDAPCGDIRLGVDVKSFVSSVGCVPGPPTTCGVFVQNSLNPTVNIELAPPFVAENLELYKDCAANSDSVKMYYEFDINHNGPNALNQTFTVNFYEDIDENQSINPNVDNLIASENGTFSINDGASVQLAGNTDILAEKACQVLFEIVYTTACACDRTEKYFDNIGIKTLQDFKETITMCTGSCIDFEVCDFTTVSGDSIIGATGVPYNLELIGKHTTLPTGGIATYETMTNNSIEPSTGNFINLGEQHSDVEHYLVAHFDQPVNVSSLFIGGGQLAGWSFDLQVYTSSQYILEYSHDNVNWFDSGLIYTGPDGNYVQEEILPIPIGAQHWRMSSRGVTAWWTTSEFRLEGVPLPFQAGNPITRSGNTVTVCLPTGAGVDTPWEVEFASNTGDCPITETLEIRALGTEGIKIEGDTLVCENQCVNLEVVVPNDATEGMTVSWSPAGYFTNPTDFRSDVCGITANTTVTATVTYADGACVENLPFDITYYPVNDIDVQSNSPTCYDASYGQVMTADSGWDIYKWYRVVGGAFYIEYSSASNTFSPMPGATYYLEALKSDVLCPAISDNFTVPSNVCPYDFGDLPDDGSGTGTVTNYETLVENNGPSHVIISGLYLGNTLDSELNGQPDTDALGDGADEDGIVLVSGLNFVGGGIFTVPLTVNNTTGQPAHLEAWIDWTADGDFDDANEMILDLDDTSGAFPSSFNVNIPVNAAIGSVVGFRLRLSNEDNMSPYGKAGSGEIEDYLLEIICEEKCIPLEIQRIKGK